MKRLVGLRVLLGWWLLLPFVPVVLWAVADQWTYPSVLPDQWGLSGWHDAFAGGALPALLRSLGLSVAVAAIATPIGAMAARALTFGSVPGRRIVEFVLLAPVAIPPFVIVMGLNIMLLRLRIPGFFGLLLVLVVAAVPYTTYVMRVAYLGHDLRYEDEAKTLGATPRLVLWYVHLPLVVPALTVSAFLAFLVGWSDYIATLLIGGGQLVTLPMLLGAAAAGIGNDSVVAVLAVFAIGWPLLLFGLVGTLRRRTADRPVVSELVGLPA